jgi:hypothetical protein
VAQTAEIRRRGHVLHVLAGIVEQINVEPPSAQSGPACNMRTGLLVLAPR